jgi:hypothetical protein
MHADAVSDTSVMRRPLLLLAGFALLVTSTACGADEQAVGTQQAGAQITLPASPVDADVSQDSTPTTIPPIECEQDRRTVEVAIEAYYANYAEYPESMDVLVGDYLRRSLDSYSVLADGQIERRHDMPCTLTARVDDTSADVPQTLGEALALMGEDFIAEVGGIECATELAEISLAAQRFVDRSGTEPVQLSDVSDDLERPITRWQWDTNRETIIPVEGSGCIDLSAGDDAPEAACVAEFETLSVAVEAYFAETGAPPADIEALFERGLMKAPVDRFVLADGVPAAVPGSGCEEFIPYPVAPDECATQRRTLEVAIEAYRARFGSDPDNEQVLVDATFLPTTTSKFYDVVYGEIVPGDNSPCDV